MPLVTTPTEIAVTSGAEEFLEARRTKMRKRRERDVVEIGVTVVEYLGIDNTGGDRHQQMILNVTKVIEGDPDIEDDLQRVLIS